MSGRPSTSSFVDPARLEVLETSPQIPNAPWDCHLCRSGQGWWCHGGVNGTAYSPVPWSVWEMVLGRSERRLQVLFQVVHLGDRRSSWISDRVRPKCPASWWPLNAQKPGVVSMCIPQVPADPSKFRSSGIISPAHPLDVTH